MTNRTKDAAEQRPAQLKECLRCCPLTFGQLGAQQEGGGEAMSIVEKYNDLVAEYSKLASAIASIKRDIDADCATEAGDCASIFEEHAFDVLERHGRVKE